LVAKPLLYPKEKLGIGVSLRLHTDEENTTAYQDHFT